MFLFVWGNAIHSLALRACKEKCMTAHDLSGRSANGSCLAQPVVSDLENHRFWTMRTRRRAMEWEGADLRRSWSWGGRGNGKGSGYLARPRLVVITQLLFANGSGRV